MYVAPLTPVGDGDLSNDPLAPHSQISTEKDFREGMLVHVDFKPGC